MSFLSRMKPHGICQWGKDYTIELYRRLMVSSSNLNKTQTEKERTRIVSAYDNQPSVDEAAKKKSVRLTPSALLYSGKSHDDSHILKNCQYLQKEMPIRIARRIMEFRSLPFIVVANPNILAVHELYIRAFNILNSHKPVVTMEDESMYSNNLRQLLEDHKKVIVDLAQGFLQCRKHVKEEKIISDFLDQTITSRLSIRILALHHLFLREQKKNYLGIINLSMPLRQIIDRSCSFVSEMALHKYGRTPAIRMSGHVNATFPYIELPLDYILPELLKNAVRATIENHTADTELPPVHITLASNDIDFVIRISDRGGGIPHTVTPQVMQYNFTTSTKAQPETEQQNIFSDMMESCNASPVGGPMHGYGFGLPTSRAYARHLGGDLTIETMQGIGTDVYLRLRHINNKDESIRL